MHRKGRIPKLESSTTELTARSDADGARDCASVPVADHVAGRQRDRHRVRRLRQRHAATDPQHATNISSHIRFEAKARRTG